MGVLLVTVGVTNAEACDLTPSERATFDELVTTQGPAEARITALRTASQLCGSGRVEFALAEAYAEIDDCHMTRHWYESLLERFDEGDAAGDLDVERSTLVEALTERQRACPDSVRFVVRAAETDSEIELVGPSRTLPIAVTPFPGRVAPGTWTLRATRDGFAPLGQRVEFEPGVRFDLFVPPLVAADGPGTVQVECQSDTDGGAQLDGQDLACGESDAGAAGTIDVAVDVDGTSTTLSVERAQNRDTLIRVLEPDGGTSGLSYADWGWITLGGGLILGGASAGLFVAALSMQDTVDSPAQVDENGTVISLTQKQAADIESRRETVEIVGIATAAIGGALVVTSIVLFALPDDPYPSTSIGLLPDLSGGGRVYWQTRF